MNEPRLGPWLRDLEDPAREQRIWQLGLLTGLRAEADGSFRAANFERGLVLDRIVELRRPRCVLEIGTGRGLGAFALAATARAWKCEIEITTADVLPPAAPQDYALELDGQRVCIRASCEEVWGAHLDPELRSRITPLTGRTTEVLPRLGRAGARFDLVFLDAGHDLFSVAHDLAYALELLAPGGAILMDDLAPLDDFGLGTCVAFSHARRWFESVECFPTEGLIFGGAMLPEAPRGMVFLAGARSQRFRVRRPLLAFWRIAGAVLALCQRSALFPVSAK